MYNNHKVFYVNHPPYAISKVMPEINYEWAQEVLGINNKIENKKAVKNADISFKNKLRAFVKVFN